VTGTGGRWTYLAWAANGTTGTTIELPVRGSLATKTTRAGVETDVIARNRKVAVELAGGAPYSEPVFVVEHLASSD
jgi:hypothetical protein